VNVRRIEGRLLNFWVAKSAGLRLSDENPAPGARHDPDSGLWHPHTFNPAKDWSHGGAVVAEDWFFIEDMLLEWFGPHWSHIPAVADQPLTWFMRAYVAIHFGDEVEDIYVPPALHDFSSKETAEEVPQSAKKLFPFSWFKQLNW